MKGLLVLAGFASLLGSSCAAPQEPSSESCQDKLAALETSYSETLSDMRRLQKNSPGSQEALAATDRVAAAYSKLEELRENCGVAL